MKKGFDQVWGFYIWLEFLLGLDYVSPAVGM
jgi:hypothetical protein